MNLKLVHGVQFSNSNGEIHVTAPDAPDSTVIKKWQYRMMLKLDGAQQFVEVVRDVKNECNGEFGATDVWMFLDWLVENDLIEDALIELNLNEDSDGSELHEIVEPEKSKRPWMKVPLQVVGILLFGAFSAVGAYLVTPLVISIFDQPAAASVSEAEIASVDVNEKQNAADSTAVRIPAVAETKEVTFASRAPIKEALPPVKEEPSLVEKLIQMRQEMAACQIRRDEYYLLDDEKGYRAEVEKISELAKEIGKIRADIAL